LKHAIERAALVARGKVITSADLPCEISKPPKQADLKGFDWEDCVDLEQGERQIIVNCLAHHSGNRAAAAATLKIDASTLWRKMRRHNLL
jgi:DNA-binding NtrC family response regulator